MIAAADIRIMQTDMPYKGEDQLFTKQSMKHQVCPDETYHTAISKAVITRDETIWLKFALLDWLQATND